MSRDSIGRRSNVLSFQMNRSVLNWTSIDTVSSCSAAAVIVTGGCFPLPWLHTVKTLLDGNWDPPWSTCWRSNWASEWGRKFKLLTWLLLLLLLLLIDWDSHHVSDDREGPQNENTPVWWNVACCCPGSGCLETVEGQQFGSHPQCAGRLY